MGAMGIIGSATWPTSDETSRKRTFGPGATGKTARDCGRGEASQPETSAKAPSDESAAHAQSSSSSSSPAVMDQPPPPAREKDP